MLRLLVIPLAFLIMLVGAMVWSGGGATKRAEFVFINRGDIHTLDLNQMSYMQDFRLTYAIREGLYNLDPVKFRPEPAVAERHDLSPDKRTYTFHLRDDAKWSDGQPVTAHDFAFSWRRMLVEPGEYSSMLEVIDGAAAFGGAYLKGEPVKWDTVKVEAVDDRTVRVSLKNPVRYFLDLVAFPPFYPRNERSMAPFRVFRESDADVMEPFGKYVEAAKRLGAGATAKALAEAAEDTKRELDPAAVAKFVAAAKDFEYTADNDRNARKPRHQLKLATEAELLAMLKLFAAMRPLDGLAAKASTEDQKEDALLALPPAQKLAKMIEVGFVRYVFDKKYTQPPNLTSNGPFVLTDWDFKARLFCKKNPHYWDRDRVKTESIEMVVSEVPQSQLLMYETGSVNWLADVTGEQAAEMEADRTDLRIADAFGTNFLTLMCRPNVPKRMGGGKNPLADVKVRQALAMALDKRQVVNTITRMKELPARTYIPPDGTLAEFTWLPGKFDPPGARTTPYTFKDLKALLPTDDGIKGPGPGLPYDPAKARALLAEAGYADGKNFPKYPILYNTGNPTRKRIAQMIQEQWRKELGIDLPIQGVEGKIFQPWVSGKDYFIATVAWYGDYPDITTFTDKYHSTNLQNDSDWQNKAYDALLAEAEVEADDAKRVAQLSEAVAMIDNEAPIIPLYHYVNLSMNRDDVYGVQPNPRNIVIWKYVGVKK
ncbi:MAG: peptide ABC transporter substrate-binding protein [Phycisphaerae bacterium]|nr:peptide ABC transporter substrate-binding protein [Tepidisphaeraceae bacterium]